MYVVLKIGGRFYAQEVSEDAISFMKFFNNTKNIVEKAGAIVIAKNIDDAARIYNTSESEIIVNPS